MVFTHFILALALSGAPPVADAAPQKAIAEEGRVFDLTGDWTAEPSAGDGWARQHAVDIFPCRWESMPALLGTVRAGVVMLTRNHATASPTAKIRLAPDTTLLDAGDLDLGMSYGPDIALTAAFSQWLGLEIRYFGIDNWDTTQTVSDPAGVRFDGFGAALAARSEWVDYSSRLYSIEANGCLRLCQAFPLLLGFRSIQLHERLEMLQLDPGPTAMAVGNRVNNYLYGFQAGIEPTLLGGDGALRIEALVKGGIYANYLAQSSHSDLLGANVAVRDYCGSYSGEAGVALDYRFSQFMAVRIGYELLCLVNVALSPNQSSTTNLLAPTASVNSSATAIYQGATAALEFVF